MRKLLLVLGLLIIISGNVCAQIYDQNGQYVDTVFHDHINRQADDFVRASLVIAEPGGALYSVFGHACLHLICDTFGLDYVYSYESENAASKLFTFLAGHLKMGLTALPFDDYLEDYANQGRGVVEYPLLLSPQAKQKLWEVMDQYVAQGMYLPYDYEKRGCAYTCYKFINKAVAPQQIKYTTWTDKQTRTRREMCYDCATKDFPWNMWFIMTLVGTEVDKSMPPQEKLIIPSELAEAWSTATINEQPLLGEVHEVLASTHSPYTSGFTPVMAAVLLLILVLVGWTFHVNYADYLVLSICTLLGLMICYLVVISELPCTNWNWLIIPFNILPAMAWPWRKYWGVYYAGTIGVWLIVMWIIPHRQIDPANILLAFVFALVLIKQTYEQKHAYTKLSA